jgi:tRNA A58 N-methylase Trm61
LELAERVDFKLRDIQSGFDETDVDALFLDLQPALISSPGAPNMKPGSFFGCILPTVNQGRTPASGVAQCWFAFTEV